MRREILKVRPGWGTTGCCPGHDAYPAEAYGNRRSEKARARDKAKEHRHARRAQKLHLLREMSKPGSE